MFMHGDGSDCDVVKQMQHVGKLQTIWILFDHVKCVEVWTTLNYNVFNSFYYKDWFMKLDFKSWRIGSIFGTFV